ncbi:MAG: head maturation protease, ClpP-related [Anaerolineae bacterium]
MEHKPIRCFEGEAKPHEAFWRIRDAVEGQDPEIELYGYISEYSWYEDDVTPAMFKQALLEAGKGGPITLRINSYGGDVIAASLMHTIIRDYPGKVTVQIDGVAASAATVVAMAGDEVRIQSTGYFMIHDPSVTFFLASLNIEDLTRLAESLAAVKEGIINAYETKTKLGRSKLAHLMSDETWMDANQALQYGFVDGIVENSTKAFMLPENVAVTNAVRGYAHVPPALLEALQGTQEPQARTLSDAERKEASELYQRVQTILRKE